MKKKYDFALVSGGFDPVHAGHLKMFQDAKKMANNVVLLLNNDEWLKKKKGKPFMNQNQRKEILEEFKSISKVIIQESSDPSSSQAIEKFVSKNPNKNICYCNGGDRSNVRNIREEDICLKLGVDLQFGVGGEKKIESSSNLTKNYLGEIEKRPWGNYHIIARNSGYQIKEIKVSINSKLSLQKHNHRAEFWQIITGKCKVTVGDKHHELNDNDHIYIPKNTFHRIENTGDNELIFVEIQLGDDIKEDDIIRIEDDYGRI